MTQYVNFKPGDRTRLKGGHMFQHFENPVKGGVPDRAEVVVCVPGEYPLDHAGGVPHVIVSTNLNDWHTPSGHWIREDALEPLGPTDEEVEEALRSIRGK